MADDPRLPSMRAADTDRERMLEVVRQAHAEGRLSTDEFYERLEAVYTAKTFGELDVVVADLPPAGTAIALPVPPVAQPVARPSTPNAVTRMPRELRAVWMTWAAAVSINLLIWTILAVTGMFSDNAGVPYFWPIWVAGPWGVVLAFATLTWYGSRRDDRS